MLEIVAGAVKIAAAIIGDRILSKWLAAIKIFIERQADGRIKTLIQEEYLALDLEWQKLKEKEKLGS